MEVRVRLEVVVDEDDADDDELDALVVDMRKLPKVLVALVAEAIALLEVESPVAEVKVEARTIDNGRVARLPPEMSETRVESEVEDPNSSLKSDDQLNRVPDPVEEDRVLLLVNRLNALLSKSSQLLELREGSPTETASVAAVAGVATAVFDDPAATAAWVGL